MIQFLSKVKAGTPSLKSHRLLCCRVPTFAHMMHGTVSGEKMDVSAPRNITWSFTYLLEQRNSAPKKLTTLSPTSFPLKIPGAF